MDFLGPVFLTAISKIASYVAEKSAVAGHKFIGEAINSSTKNIKDSVEGYLNTTASNIVSVKTLLNRTDPVNLNKIYAGADLEFGSDIRASDTLFDFIKINRRIVVTGTAGSGKSMLLKRLFLTAFSIQETNELSSFIIPFFLEVRKFSESDKVDIIATIATNVFHDQDNQDRLFDEILKKHDCIFIFDGLDEIEHSRRDDVCREILKISERYKKLKIIVSSRPDGRFFGWSQFIIGQMMPLSPARRDDLIERAVFPEDTKREFRAAIIARLGKSHERFLTNPLLCTMMLLTYADNPDLSNKMHVFYNAAFTALFNRHDLLKEEYRRDYKTTNDPDEFSTIFSAFCGLSYIDEVVEYTSVQAVDYAAKSIKFCKKEFLPISIISDLVDNVCILLLDGDKYAFLHRSFQEYFAAIFVLTNLGSKTGALIEQMTTTRIGDGVLNMMMAINKSAVEEYFLKPKLKKIIQKINKLGPDADVIEVAAIFSTSIRLRAKEEPGPRLSMQAFTDDGVILEIMQDVIRDIYNIRIDSLFTSYGSMESGFEFVDAMQLQKEKTGFIEINFDKESPYKGKLEDTEIGRWARNRRDSVVSLYSRINPPTTRKRKRLRSEDFLI